MPVWNRIPGALRHRRDVVPRTASARWRGGDVTHICAQASTPSSSTSTPRTGATATTAARLRAEIGEDKVGVSPRGGRHLPLGLVIFHSDCIPHAVEEAPERGRVAVVGWLRTRRSDEATSLRDSPRFRAAERLERFGHDGAAKRQFQRCLEHLTDPVEKAYCYARVAHCAFDGLGDRAAAAQAWRSAIELDPASAVARAGLGMTTTNATERAEALKEAQALQPRDARTALIRAASSNNDAEQLEILDGLLASSSETRCLAESLLWLHEHDFDSSKALEPTRCILEQAAQFAIETFGDDEENICAEFGTYHGRSLRVLDQRLLTIGSSTGSTRLWGCRSNGATSRPAPIR